MSLDIYDSNDKVHHDKGYENLSKNVQNQLEEHVVFKREKCRKRHLGINWQGNGHKVLRRVSCWKLLKYILINYI